LNGANAPNPHPALYYYPSAWSRTPFSMGHSPITVHQADKRPTIGAAKISIPNYKDGPYTPSPQLATGSPPTCPMGWSADPSGAWCYGATNSGSGTLSPMFTTLVPWLEIQPGVGFNFPIDGQHDQEVVSAQLDFTGVLETYIVDYIPF